MIHRRVRRRSQRGFMAAEWVAAVGALLIPAFILVASATRIPETKSAAQTIATEAARAASQERTCVNAYNAANTVAAQLAKDLGVSLDHLTFADTAWQPGGTVHVVAHVKVELVFVPGSLNAHVPQQLTAQHTEPIDTYRFMDSGGCPA